MVDLPDESLITNIGQILMTTLNYTSNNVLLHAVLDFNMIGPSVYEALGNRIEYQMEYPEDLSYTLLDLWEAQATRPRWKEMVYLIRDGKFEVTFFYPDEIDETEDDLERRERLVHQYLGEKPIYYPPWPTDPAASRYDL